MRKCLVYVTGGIAIIFGSVAYLFLILSYTLNDNGPQADEHANITEMWRRMIYLGIAIQSYISNDNIVLLLTSRNTCFFYLLEYNTIY